MIIRYLSVGCPAPLAGSDVISAIVKQPVEGPVHLNSLGFAGDEQADLEHHGGVNKAVCVYAYDRYAYWEKELERTLGPSAFGENLTVEGLPEEAVKIGDIYRVGGAMVQVVQPRIPCHKVNRKFGRSDMVDRVTRTCFTGYYLKVVQEGPVQAGDRFELVERNDSAPTVMEANQVLWHDFKNREALEHLLTVPNLAPGWLKAVRKRLDNL